MKKCTKCNTVLTNLTTYLSKGSLLSRCRECLKVEVKNYKLNNVEKVRLARKKYRSMESIHVIDSGLYRKYSSIRNRCFCKSSGPYKYYGGKGITCSWARYSEFKKDMMESFLKHVSKHGLKDTTIERNDVLGNYCRENCRWATWQEQRSNKRIHIK